MNNKHNFNRNVYFRLLLPNFGSGAGSGSRKKTHSARNDVSIVLITPSSNSVLLSQIRNMRKYCDNENIDLEILTNLNVFNARGCE
jgi:hypothetical protein